MKAVKFEEPKCEFRRQNNNKKKNDKSTID